MVDRKAFAWNKLRNEPLKCKSLSCEVEMSYPGQKKTVVSLADKILSRPTYTEFPLYISKNKCEVSVLTGDAQVTQAGISCINQ